MKPTIVQGDVYIDERGSLFYNNNFDATSIKRIYFIENKNTSMVRGWQGHKMEQRWFSVVTGKVKVQLIKVDNWETPSKKLIPIEFILDAITLNILHIPKGYITSIQSLEKHSKLMVMADYVIGEIEDEYRYPNDYFENV
jgi:dTDP-4-dehydrorhamnose 3,5-epimerase-like enzyme